MLGENAIETFLPRWVPHEREGGVSDGAFLETAGRLTRGTIGEASRSRRPPESGSEASGWPPDKAASHIPGFWRAKQSAG